MTSSQREKLQARSLRVREHIIRMSARGGCFVGAALSCADMLVYLYSDVLRVSPASLDDPDRDYFFLSKGHAVPALYSTLAELNFFNVSRLHNHLKTIDSIYWHPNQAVPGVEFHSGSLGHGLAVAEGVALDLKMLGTPGRAFVLLGDGELNEGSVWEALLVAAAHRLDNLVVLVDRNGFQANMRTEDLIPLEPLDAKFRSFGWATRRINGHDFDAMERAFASLPLKRGQPSAVICDTVRGKGLPSIEQKADMWFVNSSQHELDLLLRELHHGAVKENTDVR